MGRVGGKVAVVSGGASGIGAACVRALAREGATVVIADLQVDKGEALREEIASTGGTAYFRSIDVTDEDSWSALMEDVLARFGRMNILVNCAGIGARPRLPPSEATLEHWRNLMAVNLDGVFLGTKHAVRAMKRSDPVRGSIINISSVLGLVGSPDMGAYCASKGGVRLYSKSVALSCAQEKLDIRVNSVHPGFIDTPLLRESMRRFNDVAEAERIYNDLQPVGHIGQPEDIAYGVLYLASDEARFVTGAELVIDGGFTAR
jgi:NAD(P)-dependent dehydrogenase (short-subunit alcohol dehydrogenase family)